MSADPRTMIEIAESGTTRELLVAMRNRIASAVESPTTPARDLAALTKRLMEVVDAIASIDARVAEQEAKSGGTTGDEAFHAASV